MKNTFGNSLTLTLFGESHGEAIGAVLDGLPSGVKVDHEVIAELLSKRRPSSSIDTARQEKDEYRIVSGLFEGRTTGTPLCILIPNEDKRSGDYAALYGKARPAHADYAAYCKYHGFEDYRGGGHFSGRITAALVAAGGILLPMLESLGITVGTHIKRCAKIEDRDFEHIKEDIALLNAASFPVLDAARGEEMTAEILKAKFELDSVGGVAETAVLGMPAGVGEPWFDSVEGLLSHALFSLGGVKGIEFGMGFGMAESRGSLCNDAFRVEEGRVVTKTNHNGGINGGITNGMPLLFRCAVKPTPSIAREQDTVDFLRKENVKTEIKGRHDPAIVRRICPVINSVTALVLCDLLMTRYGTDIFLKGRDAL
ncbi:MAG: chorismate synthase [Clostridia bacterium]|nr:chorismate synthase [Clostridia bacterium]